jgi:DNA-binding transcriptional regulator YdaS (Cro superfamily)
MESTLPINPLNALRKAIKAKMHGGRQTSLAQKIGRTQGYISMLLFRLENGSRTVVPPDVALKIEAATHGEVTRRDLNPEFDWDAAAVPAVSSEAA